MDSDWLNETEVQRKTTSSNTVVKCGSSESNRGFLLILYLLHLPPLFFCEFVEDNRLVE
jgi:hypothetical protein